MTLTVNQCNAAIDADIKDRLKYDAEANEIIKQRLASYAATRLKGESADDLTESFCAYCIMSDFIRGRLNLGEGVITSLRRNYPDEAQRVEESYYEWMHDL